MEQAAVEDGVELLAELAELECVPDDEARRYIALGRLAPGYADSGRRGVDAGCFQAALRRHECVLAGAAADVEDASAQRARVRESGKGALRAADVPRRSRGRIAGVEVFGDGTLRHAPVISRLEVRQAGRCEIATLTRNREGRFIGGSASVTQREHVEPFDVM